MRTFRNEAGSEDNRLREGVTEVGRVLYAASDYMRVLFGEGDFTPEDTDA